MLTIWCNHSSFIRHLLDEIAHLREDVSHERQRAEIALDELLRVRVGAGPVTVPTPAEAAARESQVERLLKSTEFMTAGIADEPAEGSGA